MAYWYYWDNTLPRNSASYQSYSSLSLPNITPYDFILDNITYNIDNITNSGLFMRRGTAAGGSYRRIYYVSLDGTPSAYLILNEGIMRGRISLFRTKTRPGTIPSSVTELVTGSISGKYRLKETITTQIPDNLRVGTIPVKFAINGVNYNYFCFDDLRPQYTNWTGNFRSNSYSFGGYVNPIDMSINTEGDAEDYTRFISSSNIIKTEFQNKIIDFGDLPQEVPQIFIDWINANFDYVYPYKYTIKSPDGVTLAEQGELPPIRNITLSTTGNNVNMILTGSNGVDYTLTWSHTVPEGKIFLGLGYAATEKRASIPSGTTTAVTWDSDITVYEIYGKYVPPATTFTITLYQNTAENNRVDKTNYLTSVGSINGTLRAECSILRPSIIIAQDTLPTFNYVYIAVFGRYYFVTGITSVNFGLWRIELNTDVLMTYQTGVKALTAIIARQENDYNDDLIDTEILTEKEPTITYQEIPNTVLNTQEDSDKHSFVVTVVGN